jgi:hypothetical protein
MYLMVYDAMYSDRNKENMLAYPSRYIVLVSCSEMLVSPKSLYGVTSHKKAIFLLEAVFCLKTVRFKEPRRK